MMVKNIVNSDMFFFNMYASNIYRRELLDICTRREFDPTARRLDIPLGHC